MTEWLMMMMRRRRRRRSRMMNGRSYFRTEHY